MDGGTPNYPKPQLQFKINNEVIANNVNIYSRVKNRRGEEIGVLKMCVRSSFGYASGAFQEFNFVEFLVEIKYDSTAGFTVDAFSVEPKERLQITAVKPTYALEAYVCDPAITSTVNGPGGTRTIPDLDTTYDSIGGTDAFNHGGIIAVCVIPDDPTYADGFILNRIEDFTWIRDSPLTSQEAIVGGAASLNRLTHFPVFSFAEMCYSSSILIANFYILDGFVYGIGNAELRLRTRRRLGEGEDNRQLEWDKTPTCPFDLCVAIDRSYRIDDPCCSNRPDLVKTAGGASFGPSSLATAAALLSTALMA